MKFSQTHYDSVEAGGVVRVEDPTVPDGYRLLRTKEELDQYGESGGVESDLTGAATANAPTTNTADLEAARGDLAKAQSTLAEYDKRNEVLYNAVRLLTPNSESELLAMKKDDLSTIADALKVEAADGATKQDLATAILEKTRTAETGAPTP